jgi:hypothetical protein
MTQTRWWLWVGLVTFCWTTATMIALNTPQGSGWWAISAVIAALPFVIVWVISKAQSH